MLQNTKFYVYYFLGWIGIFTSARALFYFFNFHNLPDPHKSEFYYSFIIGLRLDISISSYLTSPVVLLGLLSIFFKPKSIFKRAIQLFTYIIILIITFLILVDTQLFPHWGNRLDSTILNYINTPDDMLASIKTGLLLFNTISWLVITLILFFAFKKIISYYEKVKFKNTGIIFTYIVLLAIGIRGGLQQIPINQSNVYFSKNQNANHLAINGIWNLGHSYVKGIHEKDNPYIYLDSIKASKIIRHRINEINSGKIINGSILNIKNPNIILIIWESLTSKIVGPLKGYDDVTPSFDKLCKEGLLFTNFYSNGDRSDKGLVSLLSSYYPQCQRSIIKSPRKIKKLPSLPKYFSNKGYKTTFYYGGDINFGNMNTYLIEIGVEEIISGIDFDKKERNSSKWGVHDHILLERVFKDLEKEKGNPFFKTIFTLTSHEPYDIPVRPIFKENTEIDLFKSAHNYSDQAIHEFISLAKTKNWWHNTLVIITGDHGHRLPMHKGNHNSPAKFHIPMLWLGGALDSIGLNKQYGSQTDLSLTLINQLDPKYESINFPFSKNLFSNSTQDFAHYIFNNGFGTINDKGNIVYDYNSKNNIEKNGVYADSLKELGLAITQSIFTDYLNR